jgi:hypothetical protein
MRAPNVMEVHPAVPAKTVPEFIAYAKSNPGKITMASTGIGTSTHLSGELFKVMAGVDMVHVPYRGNAPALTDLLAGQVHVLFDSISTSVEHVRDASRMCRRPRPHVNAVQAKIIDCPQSSECCPACVGILSAIRRIPHRVVHGR